MQVAQAWQMSLIFGSCSGRRDWLREAVLWLPHDLRRKQIMHFSNVFILCLYLMSWIQCYRWPWATRGCKRWECELSAEAGVSMLWCECGGQGTILRHSVLSCYVCSKGWIHPWDLVAGGLYPLNHFAGHHNADFQVLDLVSKQCKKKHIPFWNPNVSTLNSENTKGEVRWTVRKRREKSWKIKYGGC